MSVDAHTGGCQCGAIRFRVTGPVDEGSICHCRMCQKATGGLFGAAVLVDNANLAWTRRKPSYFQSSSVAKRGFCPACGTPLTFVWVEGQTALNAGTFDRPEDLTFKIALATEHMHSAVPGLTAIPPAPMFDTPEAEAAYENMVSHQHPDHDTDSWPQ